MIAVVQRVSEAALLLLAKISKEQETKKFILISSVGANKNSSIFYSQVKEEVEAARTTVAFAQDEQIGNFIHESEELQKY